MFIIYFIICLSSEICQCMQYPFEPYLNSKIDLYQYNNRRDKLYSLSNVLITTNYDFSHLKCATLEGINKQYSWYDIKEYSSKLNKKKMIRVINKIRAAGEYYLKQNNLKNFAITLNLLSCLNEAFWTSSFYVESFAVDSFYHGNYKEFYQAIHEVGFRYYEELFDLYVKKHGNLQVLLNKLSNP